MDNDLMARRLRPPSEPMQTTNQPPSMHPADPTEDWTPPTQQSAEGAPAWTPAPDDAPVWTPPVRDDVPWDRPTDFDPPTDTATLDTAAPDEPAWDRPTADDWVDPDPVDDRTPDMFDANPDSPAGQMPAWPMHAAPVATVVSASVASNEFVGQSVATDPDDAYAPVLGDVSQPVAHAWPEPNGHDSGRNDPTISAERIAQAPVSGASSEPVGAPLAATADWHEPAEPAMSWPESTAIQNDSPPAAVEPTGFAQTGFGPTPPAGLFGNGVATFAHADPPEPAATEPLPSEPEPFAPIDPAPEPVPAAAVEQPQPETPQQMPQPAQPYSTAPAPQAPLVVRIELAILDDSHRLVSAAEAARRVNELDFPPATPEPARAEVAHVTPRHPAFEPRGNNGGVHDAAPVELSPFVPEAPAQWIEPTAPQPTAPVAPVQAVAPAPWQNPQQAPVSPPDWQQPQFVQPTEMPAAFQPATAPMPPWGPAPASFAQAAWPNVDSMSVPTVAPTQAGAPSFAPPPVVEPAPAAAPPWAQPASAGDPLAGLPAAPTASRPVFAPPPAYAAPQEPMPYAPLGPAAMASPVTQQLIPHASVAAPAFAPPPYVEPERSQPLPAASPRMVASAALPAVSAQDQSDLWFLATEPDDVNDGNEDAISEGKEPSQILTAILTIGMAILVIVLVLVFIQLMTSLLR
ncbi:MAG: hypothetical protein WD830_08250 [Chloroflexota bacterium]